MTRADLAPGTEFAGFRIVRVIGRGGMGVVYLADQVQLERRVALKVLAPQLTNDERFRERFIRESRIAAGLEHPNVLPVYEAGESDGELYIAMRFVEGTDLRAMLRRGPLETDRTLAIVGQLAAALDAAHARGLVHRDVKPGNVLIAQDPGSPEHVYLSDFGLSKRAASDSGVTGTGQFVGTLTYAAPEQFTGAGVGSRTDVYSLGCVLFECLAGRAPFRADDDAGLMYAHVVGPIPRLTVDRPDLPPAIDDVFERALARSPDDRPPSAGALAREARGVLREGGPPPMAGAARRPRRRWLVPAAVGLIVAAVVAAMALRTERADPDGSSDAAGPAPPPGAVASIDPDTGRIRHVVGGLDVAETFTRSQLAAGEGGVWVLAESGEPGSFPYVTKVDPEGGTIDAKTQNPFDVGVVPGIEVAFGDVVATSVKRNTQPVAPPTLSGALSRFSAATGARVQTVGYPATGLASGLAVGEQEIWALFAGGTLLRIEPRTLEELERIEIPGNPETLAADGNQVWVGDNLAQNVRRVDPRTGSVSPSVQLGIGIDAIAVFDGIAWVLDRIAGTVTPVDPISGAGRAIRVGARATDIAAGLGAVWVSDAGGSVWRIDRTTRSATEIHIGTPLAAVAIDEEQELVWVLTTGS